ncbi:MAG TPA: hypothetical protein VJW77_14440 [Terriglobia bacterium]|nr:hypothetical protein [Terriglobia bacterium]
MRSQLSFFIIVTKDLRENNMESRVLGNSEFVNATIRNVALPANYMDTIAKRSDQVLIDHFQCPPEFVHVGVWGNPSARAGFFNFGPGAVCYGRCSAFAPSLKPEDRSNDAMDHLRYGEDGIELPFNLAEAVNALRHEKYLRNGNSANRSSILQRSVRAAYYAVRPAMPVPVRKHLQRYSLRGWDKKEFPRWPVETGVESALETAMCLNMKAKGLDEIPFIWFWPDGAEACAVMTHDVESPAGRDFCDVLMDIDDSYGIKSSFCVVPESRYEVSMAYLDSIRRRGFEVNVHDLNHDGNLYRDYEEFRRRAVEIEEYRKIFAARGFRAGVLYRNIDWFGLLHFEYDMSVPNVAHLDPQHGGCCTTFPYFIGDLLEIPVTMTQDYSLFNILRHYRLDLWEMQIDAIRSKHGVMNFIVHPDYIRHEPELKVYERLLAHLAQLRKSAGVWIPLPGELNQWWRERSRMKLVRNGAGWEIEGDGKVRARIAYARLENDQLAYSF